MGRKIVSILCVLLSAIAVAQQPSVPAATPAQSAPPTAGPPSQAVSTTGLLPVFGVDLKTDAAWIDASSFPSQSPDFPNSGTSSSFQRIWDALKVGGLNILRVDVDLSSPKSSTNRAANLCTWAKNNNVMLDLVLRASTGKGDYSDSAANFVKNLASSMGQEPATSAYGQIAFYELEPDWNNPSLLKQGPGNANRDLLLKTASALHKAQAQIAQVSGVSAKPVVIGVSFDWELIAAKSIAGTQFNKDAYQKAYSSLASWLKPIGASADVDVISVSWLPGTISAGGVETFRVLISSLAIDLSTKLILLRTGFSTTFHSMDEQRQYYVNTFSTLASLRASAGTDSRFVGVIFQGALNAPKPAANSDAQSAMAKWNWPSKADELAAMWRDGKSSGDMNWWLGSIDSGMGIISAQTDSLASGTLQNSGGLDALTQVAQAVASASAAAPLAPTASAPATMGPTTTPPDAQTMGGMNTASAATMPVAPSGQMPAADNNLQAQNTMGGMPAQTPPSGAKGFVAAFSQTFQAKSQQGLASILDTVFQRLGTSLQNAGTGGGSRAMVSSIPAAYPPPSSAGMMPVDSSGMNSMNAGGMNTAIPSSSMSLPSPTAASTNMASVPAAAGSVDMNGGMPPAPSANVPSAMNTPVGGAAMSSTTTTAGMMPAAVAATTSTGTAAPSSPTATTQGAGNAMASPKVLTDASPQAGSGASEQAPGGTLQRGGAPKARTLVTVSDGASTNAGAPAQPQEVATAVAAPAVAAPAANTSVTPAASTAVSKPAAASNPSIASPAPSVDSNAVSPANSAGLGKSSAPPGVQPVSPPSRTPEGFAKIGDITPQGMVIAGQPAQLVLPISNPNPAAFSNIRAMLMIDGKAVQTQTVAALMPQETRFVTFPQVVVAQPGAHEVKIGIQLQRENSRPQMGIFNQVLMVQPAPAAIVTAPVLQKPAGAVPAAALNTLGAKAVPGGVAAGTSSSPSASRKAELTLLPGDLTCSSSGAIAGQTVDFHVLVRNQSDIPTRAGVLVLTLLADGKPVASTEPALQFAVAAKGTYQANWRAVIPAGNRIEFAASVSADGSIVPGKAQASILIKNQAPAALRPPASGPVKRIP